MQEIDEALLKLRAHGHNELAERLAEKAEVARNAQASAEAVKAVLVRQVEHCNREAAGEAGEALVLLSAGSGDEARSIACARALVRSWSPAFEALLRHGNGLSGDNPAEVDLGDVEPWVLEAVCSFMSSGELPHGDLHLPPPGAEVHPLLEFADRYDLAELKDAYTHTLLQHKPLGKTTVAAYLNLAHKYNVPHLRVSSSGAMLALPPYELKDNQFMHLIPEAAKEILSSDDLKLGLYGDDRFKESEVLKLIRQWIRAQAAHQQRAWDVVQSLRLDLLGFVELMELESGLDLDRDLRLCAAELRPAIRDALVAKLSAAREDEGRGDVSQRSAASARECTVLVTASDREELAAKMAQCAFRLSSLGSERGAQEEASADGQRAGPVKQERN